MTYIDPLKLRFQFRCIIIIIHQNNYVRHCVFYSMQLIDKVDSGGGLGKVCLASNTTDVVRISQLTLSQQIKHGLF